MLNTYIYLVQLQLKTLITENNTKGEKDGVMITEPGHLMIGNT